MFLAQGIIWKPQFTRRYDMAHSPQHFQRTDMKELRSRLFPERRYIPGRKGKMILGLCFGLQFIMMYEMAFIRKIFK